MTYGVLRKNYELLNDGGVILHIIDTHPHTWHRFDNPYIFLTIADWVWRLMYKGRAFITRRMPNEYIDMAVKAGFKVTVHKREIGEFDVESLRHRLLPRYRTQSSDELLTQRAYLVLTK